MNTLILLSASYQSHRREIIVKSSKSYSIIEGLHIDGRIEW